MPVHDKTDAVNYYFYRNNLESTFILTILDGIYYVELSCFLLVRMKLNEAHAQSQASWTKLWF